MTLISDSNLIIENMKDKHLPITYIFKKPTVTSLCVKDKQLLKIDDQVRMWNLPL